MDRAIDRFFAAAPIELPVVSHRAGCGALWNFRALALFASMPSSTYEEMMICSPVARSLSFMADCNERPRIECRAVVKHARNVLTSGAKRQVIVR
jgi:hypothetical protein